MKRRPRTLRTIKWIGLVWCLLLLIAWLVSLQFWIHYGTSRTIYSLQWGGLNIRPIYGTPLPTGWAAYSAPRNWIIWPRNTFIYRGWWPGFVPLWIAFFVFCVPTIVLWRLDRRRFPPGFCSRCGYDLTGNESGICPECGTARSDMQRPPSMTDQDSGDDSQVSSESGSNT